VLSSSSEKGRWVRVACALLVCDQPRAASSKRPCKRMISDRCCKDQPKQKGCNFLAHLKSLSEPCWDRSLNLSLYLCFLSHTSTECASENNTVRIICLHQKRLTLVSALTIGSVDLSLCWKVLFSRSEGNATYHPYSPYSEDRNWMNIFKWIIKWDLESWYN
jgi:hypothetical protein